MPIRVVSAEDIDRILGFPALIDALHEAFAGDMRAPERHHHAIGPGPLAPMHLLMPAWTGDAPGPGSFIGTKLVNIFPRNGARGLPAVLGTYLLQSGETGEPLVAMDGTRLTHWRTAAASGLAARFLARPDARHLVMVGAGALAPFLVRSHAAVRDFDRITIWNRNREGAERVARQLVDLGVPVAVGDDLASCVATADVVSCATLATAPLLRGAWLRPGTHVDLVGAFTMAMREADDATLQSARLFVDTEAALTEGGDVAIALASGAIARSAVEGTLFDLCRSSVPWRREPAAITVFKSVGTGIEDLAAAMLVWRELDSRT